MSLEVSPDEYNRLTEFLSSCCGIELGENKQYLVSSRLKTLLAKHNLKSIADLLSSIKNEGKSGLKQQVIDAMTTHETLWFRDGFPYEVFSN